MLREKLLAAIRQAVTHEQYGFQSGCANRIHVEIARFPSVWMLPLQLTDIEGRHDGFVTYKATLFLMQLNKKLSAEEKEQQWGGMERSAIRIIDRITFSEPVFNVARVRCTPEEMPLTNHGEIAMRVECEIRMRFGPEALDPTLR